MKISFSMSFLKASMLIMSANLLGNAINYLYHPVTARFLNPSDYGLLESFVALNYFLAVLTSAFSLTIIYFLNGQHKNDQVSLVQKIESITVKMTGIGIFVTLLAFFPMKHLLHIENPYLLFIFLIQVLFAFIPTLYTSILCANQNFAYVSLISVSQPLIKLGLTLMFLMAGLGIIGALWAMTLVGLFSAIISMYLGKKSLRRASSLAVCSSLPKDFWSFFILSILLQAGFTSFYNIDILSTRYYFPGNMTGIYASASIIGRIIFFLTTSIVTVAFPLLSSYKNQNTLLKRTYVQALIMASVICIAGNVLFIIFPHVFTILLYGISYLSSPYLVTLFVLFMSVVAIYYINMQYLLIIKPKLITTITVITAIAQVVLLFFSHASTIDILFNSLIIVSLGLMASFGVILYSYHRYD